MNAKARVRAFLLIALSAQAVSAPAASTIAIVNADSAGQGFNDATVVAPVAGNSGTTLGAQRLIVFQTAAAQWAALLNSAVTINVQASMPSGVLTCSGTSATLGSAGALNAAVNFPNAPRANVAYSIAEANALAGSDQDPGFDDIQAQFNGDIDNGTCLTGETWWYGIDPAVTPPADTIPLLPVVFHELGHGLGFTSFTSASTGKFLTAPDPPVWADYLFDTSTNLLWKNMTNNQRKAAAINDPHLVWTGPRTNRQAGGYLRESNALVINTPAPLAGPQEVGTADFGPVVPASGVSGDLVLVDDGTATTSDGCETLTNGAAVSGNIALIDRGNCNFTVKVKNAQDAGAIAAVVANNAVDALRLPFGMSGSDPSITIPSYTVTQGLGNTLKANLPAPGVNVTLSYANIGVDQGCVRMFAPDPLLSGSSVSHFHADASPDLLMEPSLNTTIFNHTDLTLLLFADIDWSTNNLDDFVFYDGFEANPCQHVQP